MKIEILGAMLEEVRTIGHAMTNVSKQTIAGREYWLGELTGRDVALVFSGWGKVAAASTTTTLIDRFGCGLVLFTGVAGAASNDLEIGAIVIASSLIQHDMDVSASGLFARFEIPLLGISFFPVSIHLSQCALTATHLFLEKAGGHLQTHLVLAGLGRTPNVYLGIIASGDQFIASAERLAELRSDIPDLLAVEMEGAAVAQVCYEHGVECVVIRSISDRADHTAHLDFPKFVEHVASFYSLGIVTEFSRAESET